jgi:hypothetical protein
MKHTPSALTSTPGSALASTDIDADALLRAVVQKFEEALQGAISEAEDGRSGIDLNVHALAGRQDAGLEPFKRAVDSLAEQDKDKSALLDAMVACVPKFFGLLTGWPESSKIKSSPLALRSSTAMECLRYLLAKLRASHQSPSKGGFLLRIVLEAMTTPFSKGRPFASPTITGELLDLFVWFVEEILEKEGGIPKFCDIYEKEAQAEHVTSPLAFASCHRETEVVSYLLRRGADVGCFQGRPQSSPGMCCFSQGLVTEFEALLDNNLSLSAVFDLDADGTPGLPLHRHSLFSFMVQHRGSRPSNVDISDEIFEMLLARRHKILEICFERQPQALAFRNLLKAEVGAPVEMTLLDHAVHADDLYLFRELENRGLEILEERRPGDLLPSVFRAPTLLFALNQGAEKIVRYLVEERGLLKDWRTRLSQECQASLAEMAGWHACASVTKEPSYQNWERASSVVLLDILLRAGFDGFTDAEGNSQLWRFLCAPDKMDRLDEKRVLELLQRLHAAGSGTLTAPIFYEDYEDWTPLHAFAYQGWTTVVDFLVETVGISCDVIATQKGGTDHGRRFTPLTMSIPRGHSETVLLLVLKYKARSVLEGLSGAEQPIIMLMNYEEPHAERIKQGEDLRILKAMIKNDRDIIMDQRYYGPTPDMHKLGNPISWLFMLRVKRNDLLSCLLEAGLEGTKEAVNAIACVRSTSSDPSKTFGIGPPSAIAANVGDWEALKLLIRHGATVTYQGQVSLPLPYGLPAPLGSFILPSALRITRAFCTDRRLLALVEAAARREITEAIGSNTAAGDASAASTPESNVAEDSTFKAVTSEKEEKKKAKKRAAKKKAKEKKRADAATKEAHVGAGKEAEGNDSDSDSSGEDEEEAALDEEEKMLARAPTFDLEKERAVRKARAEAEAAAESMKIGK